ncbi:MAG: hypothetical protein R3A47_00060 [Polyangiales bacterium]
MKTIRLTSKLTDYMVRFARVSTFLFVVGAACSFFLYRNVNARVEQLMAGMGEELMRYPGGRHSDTRVFLMNGARLMVRTAIVEQNVNDVLDHYEDYCKAHDGQLPQKIQKQLADAFKADVNAPQKAPWGDTDLLDTTARFGMEEGGVVACPDTGNTDASANDLLERLKAFVQTGDISKFGDIRFVYARPFESNGVDSTHVVMVWSEDSSVNVLDMFPEVGDAPGKDVDGVPRPQNGRRILSAWEQGEPYGVTEYEVPAVNRDALAAQYRKTLPSKGWNEVAYEDSNPELGDTRLLVVEQNDRIVTLLFEPDGNDALVTMLTSD